MGKDKDDDKIKKGYAVGGYNFKTKDTAQEAKDELNAIKYMTAKTDTKDPKQVYLLYNKLLDKELFRTQIGINYLKQLQQFLYVSEEIPNDKIRPIPVNFELQEVLDGRREITNNKGKIYRLTREKDSYKDKYTKLIIVNVVLVIIIAAMIAITMTSSNPTIIDYENKLVDKYAGWQEQLESQEESLKQREQELFGR